MFVCIKIINIESITCFTLKYLGYNIEIFSIAHTINNIPVSKKEKRLLLK